MLESPPEIRQITATLPYFHERVPMLYMRNGTPYVPLVVLCRFLGVRMKTYLPRWRKMLFWQCARKLPLQTPTRGKRFVWCLHLGALPFWYSTLNRLTIVPKRREQLQQATNELVSFPDIVYREKCHYYKHFWDLLSYFLATYTDAPSFFEQLALQITPFLKKENQIWLKEIIAQGQEIISEALTVAQKILHEQETLSLIEMYRLDHYGTVVETGFLPLHPTVLPEDQEHFSECLTFLEEWHQDLISFLQEQKQEWR